MLAKMILCHVLGGLVKSIQSGRVVDSSSRSGPSGEVSTPSASDTNLAEDDSFVSALSIPLDVISSSVIFKSRVREV